MFFLSLTCNLVMAETFSLEKIRIEPGVINNIETINVFEGEKIAEQGGNYQISVVGEFANTDGISDISGNNFEGISVEENNFILDESFNVVKANYVSSKTSICVIEGEKVFVPKGARLVYEKDKKPSVQVIVEKGQSINEVALELANIPQAGGELFNQLITCEKCAEPINGNVRVDSSGQVYIAPREVVNFEGKYEKIQQGIDVTSFNERVNLFFDGKKHEGTYVSLGDLSVVSGCEVEDLECPLVEFQNSLRIPNQKYFSFRPLKGGVTEYVNVDARNVDGQEIRAELRIENGGAFSDGMTSNIYAYYENPNDPANAGLQIFGIGVLGAKPKYNSLFTQKKKSGETGGSIEVNTPEGNKLVLTGDSTFLPNVRYYYRKLLRGDYIALGEPIEEAYDYLSINECEKGFSCCYHQETFAIKDVSGPGNCPLLHKYTSHGCEVCKDENGVVRKKVDRNAVEI